MVRAWQRCGAGVFLLTALVWTSVSPAQEPNPSTPGGAQFGSPLLFEGSRCVMIPFAGDGHFVNGKTTQGPAFYFSDGLSGGFGAPFPLGSALSLGSSFESGTVHWNNVVVAEGEDRQSRLLLNRKATIVRFVVPRSEPPHAPTFLGFVIADADTNGDGVLDEHDATVLYLSDPLGRTLVPVTPPGAHVGTVTLNASSSVLLVQVLDGSQPGGATLLYVDPSHPAIGTPVWNSDLASQAIHLAAP